MGMLGGLMMGGGIGNPFQNLAGFMGGQTGHPSPSDKPYYKQAQQSVGAKNVANSSLLIDPTTAWLYCILWYLLQQFVQNNTTTDLLLFRPPGSVAVADNLRITFWWIVMFGAICWLALAFVLVGLERSAYDVTAVSGSIARLFAS